jgi:lipoprotein-anchoring transpeptidase ErfK/SrfK
LILAGSELRTGINNLKMKIICKFLLLTWTALFLIGCGAQANKEAIETTGANSSNQAEEPPYKAEPSIEIEPFKSEGDYKILTAETFNISVKAPGARQAELFYQPVTANDRQIRLRTLDAPADANAGLFETELQTPQDFNGEVWARISYPGGETRETARLQLAAQSEAENNSNNQAQYSNANTNTAVNHQIDDNESARSDRKTGGKIERSALKPGNGNIRITVNVPSFTLTLWQDDKEIKTFYVGVGRKSHPIPSGARIADRIILNPDWIPPDSEWVRSAGIEPYERVPADDPDNPLGKIKIPLGQAYLLHEAQGTSDIGNLVSHGCVRVLRDDIYELTRLIVRARELPISENEINTSKKDSKRRIIELNEKLPVDINYDTMVVEGGVLHIYPDVYEQKTNTVEELRAELESYKIDVSKLDDKVLKKMLDSVSSERKFVVSLDDIRAGNALEKGKTEPLTPYQAKEKRKKKSNT